MSTGNPTPNPIQNTQSETTKEGPKINPELLSPLAKRTQDILSGHGKPVIDLFNKFIKENSQKIETVTLNDLSPEQQKEIAKMVLIQHGFIEEIIQEGDEDIVLQEIKTQIETQGNANFESGVSNENETQPNPPMSGFIPDTLKPIDIKSTPKQIEQSPLPQKEETFPENSAQGGLYETKNSDGTTDIFYDEEKTRIHAKEYPDKTWIEFNLDGFVYLVILPNGRNVFFDDREYKREKEAVEIAKRKEEEVEILKIKDRMAQRAQEITEIKIALEEIKRKSASTLLTQVEKIKTPKMETFSTDFIKGIVLPMLKPHVGSIKKFELKGNRSEITLDATITKKMQNINIQATLIEKDGELVLKNSPIISARFETTKKKAEEELAPHLDKISKTIKEFIEKEKGKKVDKMEIVNGELRVIYK